MSRIAVLIIVLAVSRAGAEQSLASAYGGAAAIAPLGMANKWIGGAASLEGARLMDFIGRRDPVTQQIAWNWEFAGGPRTVGLLARIWGNVTSVYASPVTGEKWFYVDDGSRCVSDLGDVGVLVYSDAEVKEGQIVAVTGEVGVEQSFDSTGRLVRTMRPGSVADVVVLRDVEAVHPFSDEFDGTQIDRRWSLMVAGSVPSMDPSSGSLRLPLGPGGGYCGVLQGAPGDWDAEIKVRVGHGQAYGPVYVGIPQSEYPPRKDIISPTPPLGAIAVYGYDQIHVHPNCLGSVGTEMTGDTCYFRLRRRGRVYSVSYSLDGVGYSEWASKDLSGLSSVTLAAWQGEGPGYGEVTGYIDYIRFTRVTE